MRVRSNIDFGVVVLFYVVLTIFSCFLFSFWVIDKVGSNGTLNYKVGSI